ncbi:winged helix-turn-helix transcriptional regulator [Actinomyces lilanjuaniae]|uniref:winged helix-turn-helix transcriptional regulator n=1 Tax=Actinomyces lilanjuaniae TaxID=2321394 RepID=UPI0013C4FF57|nr:helix-turn-helix domain-containing protein [Actinomyces lilanjuaniae]
MAAPGAQSSCPIAGTLALVGEKWTLLILRDIHRGICRFNDLEESLGCPRAILSARLRKLVEHGVLAVAPYRDPGRRARSAYVLTAKGRDLVVVLAALQQWGLRHLPKVSEVLSTPVHLGCGSPVTAGLSCSRGHRVDADSVVPAGAADVPAGAAEEVAPAPTRATAR